MDQESVHSRGAFYEILNEKCRTEAWVPLVSEFKNRKLNPDELDKIIEAARYAPSAENVQSTHYLIVQDERVRRGGLELTVAFYRKIVRLMGNRGIRNLYRLLFRNEAEAVIEMTPKLEGLIHAFDKGEDKVLFNSPCLILFHGDRAAPFVEVNASLALQNATLMAESLGIGSYYSGYVMAAAMCDKRFARLLKLPKNHRFYGGLALGYPRHRFDTFMERNPAKCMMA